MDFEKEAIKQLQEAGHSNVCACPDCTVHIIAALVRRVIKEELEKHTTEDGYAQWKKYYGPETK